MICDPIKLKVWAIILFWTHALRDHKRDLLVIKSVHAAEVFAVKGEKDVREMHSESLKVLWTPNCSRLLYNPFPLKKNSHVHSPYDHPLSHRRLSKLHDHKGNSGHKSLVVNDAHYATSWCENKLEVDPVFKRCLNRQRGNKQKVAAQCGKVGVNFSLISTPAREKTAP